MNIFILDHTPSTIAQAHADQHVGKMLLEGCQLLCSAHPEPSSAAAWLSPTAWRKVYPEERLSWGMLPYKHTHRNHPCAIWARRRAANYAWLAQLVQALAEEWEYRFGKPHGSRAVAEWCTKHIGTAIFSEPNTGLTPFVQAMPEKYRGPDAVVAYRAYYAAEKRVLLGKPAKWTRRPTFTWFGGVQ